MRQALEANLTPHHGGADDFRPDPAGPSWQSRAIVFALRRLAVRKLWTSADEVHSFLARVELKPEPFLPPRLGRGVEVTTGGASGWPVFHVAPLRKPSPRKCVVFLHGGGWIREMQPAHWRFLGRLASSTRAHCIVPIFPVAPRATAGEVVLKVGQLLLAAMEDPGCSEVTVIGNSAGAGLALAAAQWLRDAGHRQPCRLVLLSPLLDASISGAGQRELAARDPLLDIAGLREAARLYAGDLDIGHPFISPLNGGIQGLAPITAFAGTLDLLFPDSIALGDHARKSGVPFHLHLKLDQPHNYALMPTPEGRDAFATIVKTLGTE